MSKNLIKRGKCGELAIKASFELFEEDGVKILEIFGDGEIQSYKKAPYVYVENLPWKNDGVEVVIIKDGITSIGSEAFLNCKKLKTLYLPKTLKYGIGEDTFKGCISLTSIHISDVDAFARIKTSNSAPIAEKFDLFLNGEPVREVKIKKGASDLWGPILCPVFSGCQTLEKVTLYSGYEIKQGAFKNCKNLTCAVLPQKLKLLPINTFSGCSSLKEILFSSDLETIGSNAFENCSSLDSIDIPSTVQCIGEDAFSGCINAKNISLPSTVNEIDDNAFDNCKKVEKITVEEGNENYSSIGNCLFDLSTKFLLRGCFDSVIPSDTLRIDYAAFSGCKNLKSVTVPDSVCVIDSRAFENCSSLESIVIGKSVREIDTHAFKNCASLSKITLNCDNLPEMNANSFDNCPKLMGFYKKDGSFITIADAFSVGMDKLCPKGRCSDTTRKICAMLRLTTKNYIFSACNNNSLELVNKNGKRVLVLSLSTNGGNVWPESSMPYYEWDEHTYSCVIPDNLSDEEAVEYACSHKSKWTHSVETRKSSI